MARYYFLSFVLSLFQLLYFVVLTHKYLGLFFNFQIFYTYLSATNSAHLFKIYILISNQRKYYFSFRNLICCMEICKFLKTVMVLPLSSTIFSQISKLQMHVFEINMLEKQWPN